MKIKLSAKWLYLNSRELQFGTSKLWQNCKYVPRTKERRLFYRITAESWGVVSSKKSAEGNWESHVSWMLVR